MIAVVLIANFSNSIGSLIPVERKKQIASVLERHHVTLVEDDMYGETHVAPLVAVRSQISNQLAS